MKDHDARDQAVPGLDADAGAGQGRLLDTLRLDGGTFAVRSRGEGADDDWVSGPNECYGCSPSGGIDDSREAHEESIGGFLGMICPATGYIAEDRPGQYDRRPTARGPSPAAAQKGTLQLLHQQHRRDAGGERPAQRPPAGRC